MKTLFLTIYDRIQTKNLLRTEFLREVLERDTRVILFVPKRKLEYYQREFSLPNIVIEGFAQPVENRLQFLVGQLAQTAVRTSTAWSYYVGRAWAEHRYWKSLTYFVSYIFLSNPIGWWVLRVLNQLAFSGRSYRRYFEQYHPDLVFASNITAPLDRELVREAKRQGVRTLMANKSWDTASSKGYLDIKADTVLVQNELQEDELRKLQGYRGKLIVAGYPWFDFFLDRSGLQSREEFCRVAGLDPQKKIIFYFPSAKFVNPSLEEHVEILDDLIERGTITQPAQVLVAPRPKYEFDLQRIQKLKHVVVYMPKEGARGTALDWEEVSRAEIEEFRNQTWHADVIVNATSTMSIEGALMDRPVISTNWDVKPVNYWISIRVWRKAYHWMRLMESGGVTEVMSGPELAQWVNTYLVHPETNHEGRMNLVVQQNHFTDARSAHRWAAVVIQLLNGSVSPKVP